MSESWQLYKRHPSFVLGFHGCDKEIGEAVLKGKGSLKASENLYDWLGTGIYFWEGSPERALQFATDAAGANPKTTRGKIKKPFVIGAIIDLGQCFNLTDSSSLAELKAAYKILSAASQSAGTALPENKGGSDKLLRHLDRAVIETMHTIRELNNLPAYDSVRSAFWEGGDLYPGAGFSAKAHVQLAVRNPTCIRGYFRPIHS